MSSTPEPNPAQPTDDGYAGMPKWVKWTLLAILAVIVILVLVRFVVGGEHGPGRHMSAPATTATQLPGR
jgi:hypothetical protein